MMIDPNFITFKLAALWFVLYWILGGVFFAIVVASRFIHLRKARFSCLFSVASAGLAYGAALTTLVLAEPHMQICRPAREAPQALLSLLRCAPNAVFVSGFLWFVLLVLVGLVAVLFSRATKRHPPAPSSH